MNEETYEGGIDIDGVPYECYASSKQDDRNPNFRNVTIVIPGLTPDTTDQLMRTLSAIYGHKHPLEEDS